MSIRTSFSYALGSSAAFGNGGSCAYTLRQEMNFRPGRTEGWVLEYPTHNHYRDVVIVGVGETPALAIASAMADGWFFEGATPLV